MQKLIQSLSIEKIKAIIEKNGYIKGYGNSCRLMDSMHNPIMNFPKLICTKLFEEGYLKQEGLIYKLNPDCIYINK